LRRTVGNALFFIENASLARTAKINIEAGIARR
jgi:hypothetical protein